MNLLFFLDYLDKKCIKPWLVVLSIISVVESVFLSVFHVVVDILIVINSSPGSMTGLMLVPPVVLSNELIIV